MKLNSLIDGKANITLTENEFQKLRMITDAFSKINGLYHNDSYLLFLAHKKNYKKVSKNFNNILDTLK